MKRMLLLFAALLIANNVQADTEIVNGVTFTYKVTDGKASIYDSSNDSGIRSAGAGIPGLESVRITSSIVGEPAIPSTTTGNLQIPSELGGYPVTSIGSVAFCNCRGLTSVTIPDGVTSIGFGAFFGCSGLTGVTIPDSVTSIGESAFASCSSLTGMTIPDSVTNIGNQAFSSCSGLTRVTIGNSVPNIGNNAFYNCCNLTSFVVDDNNVRYKFQEGMLLTKNGSTLVLALGCISGNANMPNTVTNISNCAFFGCSSLTGVTIPDSVTSIGEGAFVFCGFTSVTIPDSVTSIGEAAFVSCYGLKSVTMCGDAPTMGDGVFYQINSSAVVNLSRQASGYEVDENGKWNGLTVKYYGPEFIIDNNGVLTGVDLHETTDVVIPDTVVEIGDMAFQGCSGLTSVTIPDSVTSIGAKAFYGCSSLADISVSDSVTHYGEDCFAGCPAYTLALYRTLFGRGNGSGGVAKNEVVLTVTNVVVHYVTQSMVVEAVTPSEETGIVNVIAEVRANNKPVAVPSAWAAQYGEAFTVKFGADFATAVTATTGKRDGAGNLMQVWQDFVAGTDPTDENDKFTASITFDADDKPQIAYSPELAATEAAKRKYTTYGKVKLTDKEWTVVAAGDEVNYNFFKVTVEMR